MNGVNQGLGLYTGSNFLEKHGLFTPTNKEIVERFGYTQNIHIVFQPSFISSFLGGFSFSSPKKNDYLLWKGRIASFKKSYLLCDYFKWSTVARPYHANPPLQKC